VCTSSRNQIVLTVLHLLLDLLVLILVLCISAICPYLALETCRQWRLSNKTVNLMRNGKMPTVTIEQAQRNFIKAVKSGLLKILSKMGISLLSSYCGAQIFEIYGLGQEVVDLAFCGSVSKIGGLTLDEVFYNFSVRYFKSLERHSQFSIPTWFYFFSLSHIVFNCLTISYSCTIYLFFIVTC
jgi:hypothetical protein